MAINQYPPNDDSLLTNTAFGELRVAEPTPKIQVQFPYNINSRMVRDKSGGGGSVTHASGMAVLSSSASSNASGVLETVNVLKYNTGQGGLARFTAIFTSGVAGSIQTVGIGDDLDGFFFGYNGADFGILKRRDGEEEWVTRDNWNINMLPALNPQLGNVYQISYQWLGFGQIVFFAEDKDTGMFTPVHRIQYANSNLAPSILNPTLPISAFAGNTTNATDIVLKTPSLAAFTEGVEPNLGIILASGVPGSVGTTEVPIFTIRNNIEFQSKRNRVRVQMNGWFASNDGNASVKFRLVVNAGLTGASFVDIDSNTSVVATDSSATSFSGGTTVSVIGVASVDSVSDTLVHQNIVLNPGDTLTVLGRRVIGGTSTVETGLIWAELF